MRDLDARLRRLEALLPPPPDPAAPALLVGRLLDLGRRLTPGQREQYRRAVAATFGGPSEFLSRLKAGTLPDRSTWLPGGTDMEAAASVLYTGDDDE